LSEFSEFLWYDDVHHVTAIFEEDQKKVKADVIGVCTLHHHLDGKFYSVEIIRVDAKEFRSGNAPGWMFYYVYHRIECELATDYVQSFPTYLVPKRFKT